MQRPRVLALIASGKVSAVEIIRITWPFENLNNRTDLRCGWMQAPKSLEEFQERLPDMKRADLVVLHRIIGSDPEPIQNLIQLWQKIGVPVVYEADDDYSGLHRPDPQDKTWKGILDNCDAATCTTENLARLMAREGNEGVYTLPNSIYFDFWSERSLQAERTAEGDPTIMVTGTFTHEGDWGVVADAWQILHKEFPNARLLVQGGWFNCFSGLPHTYLSPVAYPDMPNLAYRQADILCCPLDPNDTFNSFKSPFKAVEGWAAARPVDGKRVGGCAVIASEGPVYTNTVLDGQNGLLVKEHTGEAWAEAIRALIIHRNLRRSLQLTGYNHARKHHDIAHNQRQWEAAYRSVLSKRR